MLGINRIIFTAHGWPFNENRSFISRNIFKILCAVVIILSHKTIAVSKNVRSAFKFSKYLTNKIQVIYNGVKEISFKELPKLSSGSSVKHVVSIGELHASKNHISVIKLLKFMKNIHYHIIGDGELKSKIEKEIKAQGVENKVTMHGHVKSAHNILPQFDIFLLPSNTEALGYVLLEASMAGLPVVARNVGGVPEVLEELKGSTLYNHDSELINILNTHNKKTDKNLAEKFKLENMISETKNLYLTLLD
jgi:glycosyltransferase involved in cell wall biosynthesis